MKTRIVQPGELESSLRAKDYVGGPEEPDTSEEETYMEALRQMDPAMAEEMKQIDREVQELNEQNPYEWDESDVTDCCGEPVSESTHPEDPGTPYCSKCGECYPTLRNPEPVEDR